MSPQGPATRPDPVLFLWSQADGLRRIASTLGGILGEDPHELDVVWVDLNEALAGHSLVQDLASWAGLRLGSADLAARGWPAVKEALADRAAKVVVALDPVTAAAVDAWRAEGLVRAPLVGVLDGLRLDPAWARTSVDRLSVADPVQAEEALELGLPAECLVPCGIPVCGGFSSINPDDKAALRERYGLPVDRPLVLMVTHEVEHDQLTGALFQLSMVGDRATLLFDVARDDGGAELLRRRSKLYGLQARMFGKVEQAPELWAAADVVVARPHKYVEQRALALRLPMVHLLPDTEAQRETARIYADRGIGRAVGNMATLAAELETQISPATLSASRQIMGEISKRSAAKEVARMVAQVAAQAEQILEEQYHRKPRHTPASAPSGAPAAAPPPEQQGPLEFIGIDPDSEAGREWEQETLEDMAVVELETNRQVSEHQQEADRWRRRAVLAAERGEPELKRAAEDLVERHVEAMHRALADLAHVAERRKELQGEARQGRKIERSFRKMEVEDALAALKKKIEREES
jgi:UDP-N-acetylglucosamine:LPS N-acetylglucosamine transferase